MRSCLFVPVALIKYLKSKIKILLLILVKYLYQSPDFWNF